MLGTLLGLIETVLTVTKLGAVEEVGESDGAREGLLLGYCEDSFDGDCDGIVDG